MTFDLVNPKSIVGLVLTKTNQHVKYESPVINRTFRIMIGNHLVYRPTDQLTYQPTLAKQYAPSSLKGGIIKILFHENTENVIDFSYVLLLHCKLSSLQTIIL